MIRQRATAFAPASSSNLAVGFDILGHPVGPLGDRVTVVRRDGAGVLGVTGDGVPADPALNTATVGMMRMLDEVRPGFGVEVHVAKGIPLGSGVGGSAASAVAGVVAMNALLPEPLEARELFRYALAGEAVASGAAHGDNVAPSLFGGLVLVRSAEPADVVRLPVPPSLRCAVALPRMRLDTRTSRGVLPSSFPLPTVIEQTANLAGVVAGCCTGDLALVARSMNDVLVEPHRAALIPGFADVQGAARAAGALGCSISGGGPAIFAWCDGDEAAEATRGVMVAAFARHGIPAQGWVSRVDGPGARVEELS
ncbi:MAG: Homoserine kinase [uncultured Gemmatimonadetes bacterium]|uniref:Homoserine kinase n=1 Tax=uncultured Gemmatimonadota bacterium TaxID=203437 RepID=A0A6J4KAU0_9BACT|nr:MAG: Homoserine kinase [uncultured Gemmatimonadota bacterium]